MAECEVPSWLSSVGWPVASFIAGSATTILIRYAASVHSDVRQCLAFLDDCTSRGERLLRRHGGGEKDVAAMADVFTLRTDIGIIANRHFGRRHPEVLNALGSYSQALDRCDPDCQDGLPIGENPAPAVASLRDQQQSFRAAMNRTPKGRFAKFVSRLLPS